MPRNKIDIIVSNVQVDSIIAAIKEQKMTGKINGQVGECVISIVGQLSHIDKKNPIREGKMKTKKLLLDGEILITNVGQVCDLINITNIEIMK